MKSFAARLVITASAATFLISGPAAAAARAPAAAYSPWASLSAFASPVSSQALCGAAASAAAGAAAAAQAGTAAAAQAGTPGCVFPAVDAPVPAPVSQTAPLGTPAAAVAGGGVGILPLLLGLAALGGVAALLLSNGEGGTQIAIST
jgi:hypothetical protein